jgi:oxygen-independent coproporphyrinogen III oxidase
MLGVYISVPFCRTKCSYCNFASDVFSKSSYESYVARVIEDISNTRKTAAAVGCVLPQAVDSVYLGGGTPSVLHSSQLERIFEAVRKHFSVVPEAEITVECAPGTLTPTLVESLLRCGVNRVSLGVQSFVDREAVAVGRLHKRATVVEEVARLREAGLGNINVDLIAGLPHQTAESWEFSLAETIAAGTPHVSVYMLEVDEDSRLGRELVAGGTRYHAHFVPEDDAIADYYLLACAMLEAGGIPQYEISNFARPDAESRHNLKYWTRQPYVGFGVDAHSMLFSCEELGGTVQLQQSDPRGLKPALLTASRGTAEARPFPGPGLSRTPAVPSLKPIHATRAGNDSKSTLTAATMAVCNHRAIRFSTPDSLDGYLNCSPLAVTEISDQAALEEGFFLGLRLNRGVDLDHLRQAFGPGSLIGYESAINECVADGLLELQGTIIRLTARGRLLSNEVFARFIGDRQPAEPAAASSSVGLPAHIHA